MVALLICAGVHAQRLSMLDKFVKTPRYVVLVDFSKPIDKTRFWVYATRSHKVVLAAKCAHGVLSGLRYATSFSNQPDSKKSSLGTFRIGETYTGIFGRSLKLDGISPGLNTNARKRAIIIHSSEKMATKWSWGCFSIPEKEMQALLKLDLHGCYQVAYR